MEMESLVPSFIYPSKAKDKISLWINSIDFKKSSGARHRFSEPGMFENSVYSAQIKDFS